MSSVLVVLQFVRAFGELGIQRFKLVQKVGEAAYSLIQQFELKECLEFKLAF